MEVDDGLLLPVFQPPVPGNLAVVLVDFAVPLPPLVELALGDAQPTDQPLGRDLGARGPMVDVVDNGVTGIVGDPGAVQSPPSSFFS
jgi:hypothetical protein